MKIRGKWAFNGKEIVQRDEVMISIDDIGFQRGYTVYEFLRTYNGKLFLLQEHFKRLQNSLQQIGLDLLGELLNIEHTVRELVVKNGFNESSISLYVTPGIVDSFDIANGQLHVYIIVDELIPFSNDVYQRGVHIASVSHKREIPIAKTTAYMTAVKINNEITEKDIFEILYTDNNVVLECSTSNIFCFSNGVLVTPKQGMLAGTTRNHVIDIAKKEYDVEERVLTYEELVSADEVFITASKKEIVPVVKVDDRRIDNGLPGEHTMNLLKCFRSNIEQHLS
jgi:branched-subunit amino acid aminotransferase/4-amino-4-deoxychorismate lyase